MDLVFLLLPLTAAIFVGKDAQKRGMNPIGWGIGVFLILIVFLPIYFMVRKPILTEGERPADIAPAGPASNSNYTLFYLGLGWILVSGFVFQVMRITDLEYSYALELFYKINGVLWSLVPLALCTIISDKQIRTIFMALSTIYLVLNLYQVIVEQF